MEYFPFKACSFFSLHVGLSLIPHSGIRLTSGENNKAVFSFPADLQPRYLRDSEAKRGRGREGKRDGKEEEQVNKKGGEGKEKYF